MLQAAKWFIPTLYENVPTMQIKFASLFKKFEFFAFLCTFDSVFIVLQ